MIFGKILKINFFFGTLIGILSVLYSGWTPSVLANATIDHFIPSRNMTGGALTYPEGFAVDPAGNIWVTHYGNNSVSKLDFNGRPLSPSAGLTGGGLNKPLGIAIDSRGNVWVANYGNNSVTKLDSSGKPLSPPTGFTGGGLNKPLGIAIDSRGNVWVANYGNNSITKLDSSGKAISPSVGFVVHGLERPFGIAIDSTGNIWVANEGNMITELIGAASPSEGEEGLSGGSLEDTFLKLGGKTMETLNALGAEMMQHELTILQIIVGVGFIGWMLLLLVHTVLLANVPGEESGLDEYGGHYDKETQTYHCITGPLAGMDFHSKKEMLKLAA